MSLDSLTFMEKMKLNQVLLPAIELNQGAFNDDFSKWNAIKLLTEAIANKGEEWVYWYSLGDFYFKLDMYYDGINCLEHALALAPNDVRSTYSLGTAYRVLTRARFLDTLSPDKVLEMSKTTGINFSPAKSKEALQTMNLTINEAAEKSISFFEQTLKLKIGWLDARHVKGILKEMKSDFFKE